MRAKSLIPLLSDLIKVCIAFKVITLTPQALTNGGHVYAEDFLAPISLTIYPDTMTVGGMFFLETGSEWYRVDSVVFGGKAFPPSYDDNTVDPYWLVPIARSTDLGYNKVYVYVNDTVYVDSVFIQKGLFNEWPNARKKRKKTDMEIEASRKSDSVAAYMFNFEPERKRLWILPFIHPTAHLRIKDTYGTLRQMFTNADPRYHYGIDYAAKVQGVPGDKISSENEGIVKMIGFDEETYGNYIVIDHGGGLKTAFFHNDSILVHVGDFVHRGQVIAIMGSTGNATGPTVHLGIRLHDVSINPFIVMAMSERYFQNMKALEYHK